MTNEEFIYWLKGFIEYQQLQEQKNPAFNMIKNELEKLNKTGNAYTIPVASGGTYGVVNSITTTPGTTSITYKTGNPITYTTN